MRRTTPTEQHLEHPTAVFPSMLCGVDGSRASLEAVRQAATLAPAGRMHLLAVTWEQGVGATAVAVLSRWRAEEALGRAQRDLRELGIAASVELVADRDATGRLLREAMAHDLLALGTHGHSRAGGIMTGSTASAALHRATIPVLISRALPQPLHLLDRVLLAVDGSEPSFAAARTAAALARRYAAAIVMLVAPTAPDPSRRHVIAACAGEILEATGIEPVILDEAGPSHRAIVRAAQDEAATLVVLGSRRLSGAVALRSVSERVAHAAPCSVLVVRGPVVWP